MSIDSCWFNHLIRFLTTQVFYAVCRSQSRFLLIKSWWNLSKPLTKNIFCHFDPFINRSNLFLDLKIFFRPTQDFLFRWNCRKMCIYYSVSRRKSIWSLWMDHCITWYLMLIKLKHLDYSKVLMYFVEKILREKFQSAYEFLML